MAAALRVGGEPQSHRRRRILQHDRQAGLRAQIAIETGKRVDIGAQRARRHHHRGAGARRRPGRSQPCAIADLIAAGADHEPHATGDRAADQTDELFAFVERQQVIFAGEARKDEAVGARRDDILDDRSHAAGVDIAAVGKDGRQHRKDAAEGRLAH